VQRVGAARGRRSQPCHLSLLRVLSVLRNDRVNALLLREPHDFASFLWLADIAGWSLILHVPAAGAVRAAAGAGPAGAAGRGAGGQRRAADAAGGARRGPPPDAEVRRVQEPKPRIEFFSKKPCLLGVPPHEDEHSALPAAEVQSMVCFSPRCITQLSWDQALGCRLRRPPPKTHLRCRARDRLHRRPPLLASHRFARCKTHGNLVGILMQKASRVLPGGAGSTRSCGCGSRRCSTTATCWSTRTWTPAPCAPRSPSYTLSC